MTTPYIPSQAPAPEPTPEPKKKTAPVFLGAVLVGIAVIALALLAGGPTTKVVATIVVLTTLLGAWRGALETASFVVALAVSAIVAFPLGRVLEDTVGSAVGLSGLAKRGASAGIAALLVLVVAALITSAVAKRIKKKMPLVASADRPIGATLGFIEGVFLSFLILWGALAIQSTAQQRVDVNTAAREAGGAPAEANMSERLARGVLALADDATSHPIGSIAASTSPLADAELFTLSDDYIRVTNDPEAMRIFTESEAMQRVREHPAVRRTVEILENDPEIRASIEHGLTRDGLLAILNSDALLDAIDETNVLEEVKPLTDDLRAALEEAKARLDG